MPQEIDDMTEIDIQERKNEIAKRYGQHAQASLKEERTI